jgi:hypothetical protein
MKHFCLGSSRGARQVREGSVFCVYLYMCVSCVCVCVCVSAVVLKCGGLGVGPAS